MSESERKHPREASIILAADERSEKCILNTPYESVFSTAAMDEQQAKELAADEFPDAEPDDFEVAEKCKHGRALRSVCRRCGRGWGDGDTTRAE